MQHAAKIFTDVKLSAPKYTAITAANNGWMYI